MSLELSIVLPCLNEERTLGSVIAEAKRFIDSTGMAAEIIVADNGSTDQSIQIALSLGARVIHVQERGYGATCRAGIGASQAEYVIIGDSDGSYDFGSIAPFIQKLRSGFDLVIGNRFRGGIQKHAMPWKNRLIGNPALSLLGRLLYRIPVGDFHCGLRGIRKAAFDRMGLKSLGMEFASEMLVKAKMLGMSIGEVPTILRRDGRDRPPHLRPWRDGWLHLKLLLVLNPTVTLVLPGLFLLAVGTFFSLLVRNNPVTLGSLRLDIGTLLYSCFAVSCGTQLLVFGAVSKSIAYQKGIVAKSAFLTRITCIRSVDRLILIALAVFGWGAWLFFEAFAAWSANGYGDLIPTASMRLMIPSVTLLAIGIQLLFGALVIGFVTTEVAERQLP